MRDADDRARSGRVRAIAIALSLSGCSAPARVDDGAASGPAPRAPSEAQDAGAADAGAADVGAPSEDAGARPDGRPRIGSVAATTWIYPARKRESRIGFLRPGTSVPLREPAPFEPKKKGPFGECKSGRWWAVEPKGFVCEDETVTRDLEGALFRALAFAGPREGAVPFDWAFSTRAPMYGKVPVEKEQRRGERRLRPVAELEKVPKSTAGHEDLAAPGPPPSTEPLPAFLADRAFAPVPPGKKPALVRREIPYGSMLSFSRAFEAEGRTFLLAPDLSLVPADRMRPFRHTSFHGVGIDAATPLPIAWVRREPRSKWKKGEGGALVETGERWPARSFVGLAAERVEQGGAVYLATREPGLFVREGEVSVVSAPEELPRGVGDEEKWIDVSLGKGTLTLFVGKRAVFSTLMSPGAGGVTPSPSLTVPELVRAALTPLGTYRIASKYVAAEMSSEERPDPESFWIADVPWVEYFRPPFAIHSAYWHEDFGHPKSGGCVNLSPEDAKVVFAFTEPQVPEGWYGAFARKSTPGTWVSIRK